MAKEKKITQVSMTLSSKTGIRNTVHTTFAGSMHRTVLISTIIGVIIIAAA